MDAPSRGSRLRQWGGFVAGVAGLAVFMIWLVLQFSGGDLDRGDKLASIVSMSVTVVTLPLSVIAIVVSLRLDQRPRVGVRPAERLDAVADTLALSVRAQWEAEERIRRVHDPFPLPVRWTNAADHLMDHWQSINGASDRRNPIILDGDTDHLLETFDRVPSGRLVVLGRAGAGKTMLASRFALALLADRGSAASRPVPVIVTLGSWNPKTRSLHGWLIRQLIIMYPVLAERDGTEATVAEQLLATGRVMPVLDGFDEIPEGLRADAIARINASLRTGDRMLMTSRPAEYAVAVATGDVLTAAAVVCIKDLTADDVRSYLPLTTRKASANAVATKWDSVLDYAYASPDGPVAEVLSTPLMVALARTVFSDTDADPTELLGYTSAAELKCRLLAGFVPAVYSHIHHDKPPCSVNDAHRYLGFLASHLQRLGTYDFAWWRLAPATAASRIAIGLANGFLMALLIFVLVGLLGVLGNWSDDGLTLWLTAGVITAVSWGVASSIVIGVGLKRWRPSPVRMHLRLHRRPGQVTRGLAFRRRNLRSLIWILVWSGNGMVLGIAASRLPDSKAGIAVGLVAGLLAGGCVRLMGGVVHALTEPVELTKTISPAELMNTDRSTALRQGLILGLGEATVLWLTIWFTFEPLFRLPFGEVFRPGVWFLGWLLSACAIAIARVLFTPVWGQWLVARTWLSLTGRLPWPIMTFLADAHRRGVLRQAGGVYQFRHARLQDHLARYA
jgi:NACHT domain